MAVGFGLCFGDTLTFLHGSHRDNTLSSSVICVSLLVPLTLLSPAPPRTPLHMSTTDEDSSLVTPPSSARQDVHLVLLLHGLYGAPANLWCLEEEVAAAGARARETAAGAAGAGAAAAADSAPASHHLSAAPTQSGAKGVDDPAADRALQIAVLNARSYEHARTWDGIDVNAHRVGEEVSDHMGGRREGGRGLPRSFPPTMKDERALDSLACCIEQSCTSGTQLTPVGIARR